MMPAFDGLTLKHFLLRQKVLSLYRTAIRASKFIPNQSSRRETILWVRAELERNRFARDVSLIEHNLTMTRQELDHVLPLMTRLSENTSYFLETSRTSSRQ